MQKKFVTNFLHTKEFWSTQFLASEKLVGTISAFKLQRLSATHSCFLVILCVKVLYYFIAVNFKKKGKVKLVPTETACWIRHS